MDRPGPRGGKGGDLIKKQKTGGGGSGKLDKYCLVNLADPCVHLLGLVYQSSFCTCLANHLLS